MRFIARAFTGFLLMGLTLTLIGFGGWRVKTALDQAAEAPSRFKPPQERVFTVNVATLTRTDVDPTLTAFGRVEALRALDLRAPAAGEVVEIAPGFRDGAAVRQGDLLFRIDPARAESALARAEIAQEEAEAELQEAEAAVLLSRKDVAAAGAQRDLRATALDRQNSLKARGVATEAAIEAAALSLSSAEAALIRSEQSLQTAVNRVARARIGLSRARITVEDEARALADTRFRAPFDGVLSEVSLSLGGLVGQNERLGVLIDAAALEVAIQVTSAQYARLTDDLGALMTRDVRVGRAGQDARFPGALERVDAVVKDDAAGRLIFARLDPSAARRLRPGDFVEVEIDEPRLTGVVEVASTAATEDGRILLVTDDDRLEEITATILRRQGDSLILGGAPDGRSYVAERLPQLGAGVKVKTVRRDAPMQAQEMVTLDPDRQARLIAAVSANTRMPEAARERVLKRLNSGTVPKEMVERIESRMAAAAPDTAGAGAEGAEGAGEAEQMITLDQPRARKIIAFVEANDRIPAPAKERILEALRSGAAPKQMVDRLERRMGG